ncbi:MAG: hypothetical protein ACLGSD_16430 [Acidobacteriota bacterium]
MKLQLARALAACAFAFSFAATAQTSFPPAPAQQEPAKPRHKGTVIFSRSTDANGDTTTEAGPAAAPQMADEPTAEDAERLAVRFNSFDMDVRLRSATHQIAVRAQITVRNSGAAPLKELPLQLSSSLHWERVRVEGRDVAFKVATLNSDADHTGQLHEAEVPLPHHLAPGATLSLDVTYSGTIAPSAQRLLTIGTPETLAFHSDWDQIDTQFTGLRGFGNVVWYPAASVPVILGDGAKLFDEMGEHKLHMAGVTFRLRLTVEFPPGQAPTVALVNGHPAALTVADQGSPAANVPGIATAQTPETTLGFEAPSLFVAIRTAHAGPNLTAWTTADNDVNVQFWIDAAKNVMPFLQQWLGQKPRAELTLLDLPDPEDAPFETGAMLATSLRDADAHRLEGVLAHALTHAWMQSPRAWLSEGVAHFMGTLWIEKQQGRERALTALESNRTALAIMEPSSPGESKGQPLADAISPVYYRTKATYVFWMLRDIVGDAALSAALRAYDPSRDVGPQTVPSEFEKLLEQAGQRPDLSWFFADWVDADKGLPDLAIQSAYPHREQAGNWIVAVNVTNDGYATAEVPVTVSAGVTTVTQRVRVPARGNAVQRILIQGEPTKVQVNDGTVPETQASVHVTRLEEKPAGQP